MPDDNLPVPYVTHADITLMSRIAKAMAMSGYFDDVQGEIQAFVKILAGREYGLTPFKAMNAIDIIKGKPVVNSGFLAAAVKGHEHYDYRVARLDNERCDLTFSQDGVEIGTSSFSMEDAITAKLIARNPNYGLYPKNMLFARALTNGVAFHCADVLDGRLYVEDAGEALDLEPNRELTDAEKAAAIPGEATELEDVVAEPPPAPVTEPAPPRRPRPPRTPEAPPATEEVKQEEKPKPTKADGPAPEPTPAARIKSESEQGEAAVKELLMVTLTGADREAAHEALKLLGMWDRETPHTVWLTWGKKALSWETLQPVLEEAVRTKLDAEADLRAATEPPFGESESAEDAPEDLTGQGELQ